MTSRRNKNSVRTPNSLEQLRRTYESKHFHKKQRRQRLRLVGLLGNQTNQTAEGEDVHLNYRRENIEQTDDTDQSAQAPLPPVGCCSPPTFVCTQPDVKGPPRQCTPEETNKISYSNVLFKQAVSLTLFALSVWYFEVVASQDPIPYGELFNCDPNDPNSIIVRDGVANDFADDGVSFCYFKSTMVLVSLVFLLPFLLETLSITTILWVSTSNDSVLVPLSEGRYVGYDVIFNEVNSRNFLVRLVAQIASFITIPSKLISISKGADNSVSTLSLIWGISWRFVIYLFPDILLTLALFPISYIVMISSDSAEDILVNLVAVQVFAQLDDIFVKILRRPRVSVGEAITSYITDNPNAISPEYSPLEAYRLHENRHEMGIKVKDMPQMKRFHDYEGMHLVT